MVEQWDPVSTMAIQALAPVIAFLDSLAFIGHNTHIVKFPALDEAMSPTATSLGMDVTTLKYTLGLFLVYPFAFIMYQLPSKKLKHFFSFIVGIVLVQWIFGPDWIHTFVSSLGTYLICALLPAKHAGKAGFYWAMGYMIMSHIYRMYVSYLSGVFDFTGTQMVLTMKLTSFAYNIYDGMHDYSTITNPNAEKSMERIYASRKKYAVTRLPSLLEFMGYIYCFTCILAGPAFEYKDYEDSIDGTSFRVKENDKDGKGEIKKPSTLLPGLTRLVIGLLCMVGYLNFSPRFPLPSLYKAAFIASTPFHKRVCHLLVAMLGERFKYYFAWKVAEGASILGGFGFEGYEVKKSDDGKEKYVAKGWAGVENIDIIAFETAYNSSLASRAWNKRTQGWLERYTYFRSGKSLYATYFVSAVWHGLYPGFFFVFFSIAIITEVERLVRVKLNPLLVPNWGGRPSDPFPGTPVAYAYWGLSWVCFVLSLNYAAQVFCMGSLERSLSAYGGSLWFGHVGMVAVYVLMLLLPGGKKDKKDKADKGKKE